MNLLIAGAGYAGRRVSQRLPGERTWTLRRHRQSDDARHLAIDLDKPPIALPTPPAPWSLLYTVPPRPDETADPRLDAFLYAVSDAPTRVVYLSTSGVYGDQNGDLTSESTPPNPQTDRAERRLAAERTLSNWCDERDATLVILRVPGIYGPGRLGLDRLRAGEPVLNDACAPPGNRIHVDDLVSACIAALSIDAAAGIYNLGDGDHRSSSAFAAAVARQAGLKPPAQISLVEAQNTWSPTRLSFVRESRRLDTRRMREVLGVHPRYADLEEGIRASLAENSP